MISVEDLTIRYRTPGGEIEALTSLSFTVARGSTLALVGESGSGKSTVALAAMGILGMLNVELNIRVLGIIMVVEVAVLVLLSAGIIATILFFEATGLVCPGFLTARAI